MRHCLAVLFCVGTMAMATVTLSCGDGAPSAPQITSSAAGANVTAASSSAARPADAGRVAGELPGVDVNPAFGDLKVEDISDSSLNGMRSMIPPQVSEWRWISYSVLTSGTTGSLSSFDLIVTAAPIPFNGGTTEELVVGGRPALLGTRYLGDSVSGPALVLWLWTDAVVEIRAGSSETPLEPLLAVAAALQPLTPTHWRSRVTDYSYPTRDATADPNSTRVELGRHLSEGVEWEAALLVPPDWRANPNDQRRACLMVTHAGVVLPENFCGDAWTIRLSNGVRFVFGLTGADVASVTLTPAPGADFPVVVPFERVVPTLPATNGVRAFVAVVPAEQCYLTLAGSDRWHESSTIRPIGRPGFPDPCALNGFPVPPTTGAAVTVPISTVPSGTVPISTLPSGTVPISTMPIGTMPVGTQPSGGTSR
ncbi:MAG: hypothetical protein ACKV2O_11315 [Acidimicrobiales bacterium]